jgi:hypothetical protein
MHRYHVAPIDTNDPRTFSFLAESIFDVPKMYAAHLANTDTGPITDFESCRHGEIQVMGDTRRWFVEAIAFTRNTQGVSEPVTAVIMVTAD